MTLALPPSRGSSLSEGLSDCLVLAGRSMRHLARNVDQTIQVIALPITLVLLFRYLFGGAIHPGGGTSYTNYLIAGVAVLCVAFNSMSTAVAVAADLQNGIVERFRSMPVLGAAVLVGHVSSAVLRNVISVALVIALGFAVGFRPPAGVGGWLAAAGILLLFATAISWLATLVGLVAGTVEGATGMSMILVFLPYASSALVPSDTMPSVLRAFVDNQPFTPVVDAVRALVLDTPVGSDGWAAVLWWSLILVAAATATIRRFVRRVAT